MIVPKNVFQQLPQSLLASSINRSVTRSKVMIPNPTSHNNKGVGTSLGGVTKGKLLSTWMHLGLPHRWKMWIKARPTLKCNRHHLILHTRW